MFTYADSAGGVGMRFVPTKCIVKNIGEELGSSSNCEPGDGNCCDNDCNFYTGRVSTIKDDAGR